MEKKEEEGIPSPLQYVPADRIPPEVLKEFAEKNDLSAFILVATKAKLDIEAIPEDFPLQITGAGIKAEHGPIMLILALEGMVNKKLPTGWVTEVLGYDPRG
jgi:hypothetical protein